MVTLRVKRASSLIDKTIGLIGKDSVSPLLIETRWGIHTFFMKQPIDILILDNDYIVRRIKENLSPFSIFIWNIRYRLVLECPVKTVEKYHLSPGKKVRLAFS